VRLPDGEFTRDAQIRQEGWEAYKALLRETLNAEDAA
jgi:hypothetical protein